jgi:hypothetical protein
VARLLVAVGLISLEAAGADLEQTAEDNSVKHWTLQNECQISLCLHQAVSEL